MQMDYSCCSQGGDERKSDEAFTSLPSACTATALSLGFVALLDSLPIVLVSALLHSKSIAKTLSARFAFD